MTTESWGSYPLKVERFKPRFIPEHLLGELSELWHTSSIPCGVGDRYARKLQTAKWFHDKYPEYSETAVYKDLDAMLSFER